MITLVANWKMAPEKSLAAADLSKKTLAIARTHKKWLELAVCPPFVFLPIVRKEAKVPLLVGAQSLSGALDVANTGLVSAGMLKSLGVTHAIVGHSESRARGERNEDAAAAAVAALAKGLTVIFCVGERSRDNQGFYVSEVKDQLDSVLSRIEKRSLKSLLIAYEPVWAIGKDAMRVATPAECREMTIYIRKVLADRFGEKPAALARILYGGSVDEHNAETFIREGGVQGLLVGRVSLEPKRFAALAARLAPGK